MSNNLIIDKEDNVEVCLSGDGERKAGHKYAIKDISRGEKVIKYGFPIGFATTDIKKGEWVHSHNLSSSLEQNENYKYEPKLTKVDITKGYFYGYKRKNRRAGIRNDIYIIPTVGCINKIAKEIEEKSKPLIKGSIDNIFAITHQFGCSQLSDDARNIKELLCSIALNPNASYVLFIGLGCENNRLADIKNELSGYDHIAFYNCQDVDDEIEYGLSIIREFVDKASTLKREKIDMSELAIGLKCGGSDGFSGITANPLVGKVCDKIIGLGGSAILSEIPEMFGAETILLNRCVDKSTFDKLAALVNSYKDFYRSNNLPVYENPSPGNKEGGITTLEEKSLGCVRKAGSSTIVDVIKYGDRLTKNGLSVLDAPGNDLIASTALGAAGCQIVLFTTGRGTPFGTFVPTLKISSNKAIASKKEHWIDFDGSTIDGEKLFEYINLVISGKEKCSSENYPEIAFFKKGVTL
ncbi:MAG: altronate dehydratase [Bacilli bacterium]|nr:altronate dehydratase [Bacilli bacterium]